MTAFPQNCNERQLGKTSNLYAPKVMRYVATGLYPAIRGSTPRGCTIYSSYIVKIWDELPVDGQQVFWPILILILYKILLLKGVHMTNDNKRIILEARIASLSRNLPANQKMMNKAIRRLRNLDNK